MIPAIRSFTELMALSCSRVRKDTGNEVTSSQDSAQRKRYIRSLYDDKKTLCMIPLSKKNNWSRKKEAVDEFLNKTNYNNQNESSYELKLIERQVRKSYEDAA